MLEQMRLQEGHLFQNESALALYLDAKAIVLEAIISCMRHGDPTLEDLAEFSDATSEKYCKRLQALSPEGIQEYHAKSLHECCKTVAKLLWPTQLLLTARPKVQTLLKGLCTRLVANDSVKSNAFLALDPMLQDFVVREAFRRTIVNDCLVVFEAEDTESSAAAEAAAEAAASAAVDAVLDADAVDAYNRGRHNEDIEEVLPSDSASQIGSNGSYQRPYGAHSNIYTRPDRPERPRGDRPRGASSVIGDDDDGSVVHSTVHSVAPSLVHSVARTEARADARAEARSEAASRAPSIVGSVVGSALQRTVASPHAAQAKSVVGSVAASVAPRVTTAYGEKSVISRSSASTGITNTNFRKPFNVRTVQLVPE